MWVRGRGLKRNQERKKEGKERTRGGGGGGGEGKLNPHSPPSVANTVPRTGGRGGAGGAATVWDALLEGMPVESGGRPLLEHRKHCTGRH